MRAWSERNPVNRTLSGGIEIELPGSQEGENMKISIEFTNLTPERFSCIHDDMKTAANELIRAIVNHSLNS